MGELRAGVVWGCYHIGAGHRPVRFSIPGDHDKLTTRGCAGGHIRVGFRRVAGLGCWRGCLPFRRGDKKDKYLARVRVREGHPTPPAFAMQTRHNFCVFRLSIQVCLQPVRGPAPPTQQKTPPDEPEGYLAANPLGLYSGPGVDMGFIPGRVKAIVLLNFAFVNKKTPPPPFF